MRTALCVTFAMMLVGPVWAAGEEPLSTRPAPPRFHAVNVYVDAGEQSLAAYQLELVCEGGEARIVGVEGGEHRAFTQPPYYDPAALKGGRIIIAAFTTAAAVPTGRTRVARIHVMVTSADEPAYKVSILVAADRDGRKIAASGAAAQEEGGRP